jgi:TRAP-type C4-dicarboxylate transport system permease small subunit
MDKTPLDSLLERVKHVEKSLVVLGSLLAFIMMVLVTLNALLRYLFNSPITGTVGVVEHFLFVGMVLLTIPFVLKEDEDIRIDLLSNRFSSATRTGIDFVSRLALLVVFVLALYAAYDEAVEQTVTQATTSLGIPIYLSWWIVVVGIALTCLRLAILLGEAPTWRNDE